MEQRMPLEKKLELAQYIREENLGNRRKIRQRENIIYGTDNLTFHDTQDAASFGTFKIRMLISVLLFAAFLLCDTNGGQIGQYTTDDVYQLLAEDSFSEAVSDNLDLSDILAFKK
jgi:hypothetical protein